MERKPLIRLSSSSAQRMGKRVVTFASQPEKVILLPNLDDVEKFSYSSSIWYTKSDYSRIRLDIKLHLQRLSLGGLPPEQETKEHDLSHYCYRGLTKTKIAAQRRRRDIQRSIQAVLIEQERQRSQSNRCDRSSSSQNDDDLLAEIYRGYCLSCRIDSERVGRLDAVEAAKVWSESSSSSSASASALASRQTPTVACSNKLSRLRNVRWLNSKQPR